MSISRDAGITIPQWNGQHTSNVTWPFAELTLLLWLSQSKLGQRAMSQHRFKGPHAYMFTRPYRISLYYCINVITAACCVWIFVYAQVLYFRSTFATLYNNILLQTAYMKNDIDSLSGSTINFPIAPTRYNCAVLIIELHTVVASERLQTPIVSLLFWLCITKSVPKLCAHLDYKSCRWSNFSNINAMLTQ